MFSEHEDVVGSHPSVDCVLRAALCVGRSSLVSVAAGSAHAPESAVPVSTS